MERIHKIKDILENMCGNIESKLNLNESNVDYTNGYNRGFDAGYKNALMYVIDLICMDEEELDEEINFVNEVYSNEV